MISNRPEYLVDSPIPWLAGNPILPNNFLGLLIYNNDPVIEIIVSKYISVRQLNGERRLIKCCGAITIKLPRHFPLFRNLKYLSRMCILGNKNVACLG